ncbi:MULTISPECIES: glycosyltransferase family 2 protein [Psychrilyobacter]|uniref:Glycosyltransferase n=1 Tax=Psychrilyobacter piezotolerans TaxID=2293438 RepID=A0ABX9KEC8_9FUSO|nr:MULTISPECIES: glycosyltransferase [Psychrilyobacter]MCS5422118.1 glycosyltransferase [Psychrilyobacter sp. S5]NDI76285.1 glycosyltransferase family 2 protein [Psychrilyobacter piezotolerans]RDE59170.1 glycosyltransferase [Psychrilyobacter sp. S5]REI39732.1 glycosyltransferase [Psychrilyobacter piezotolerans]
MPKISIIVPVYNTEKYLKKCLDSLINQTFKDIEIITVNDGSTDRSIKILENYAKKDDRIIVLDLENQGPSGARNSGIQIAKGKFTMFVDSDDWMDYSSCEKVYNHAQLNKADTVLFCYISESSSGSIKKKFFPQKEIIFNEAEVYDELYCGVLGLTSEKLRNPKLLDTLVSVWGKLYRTEILKDNNISYIDLKLVPSECQLFNLQYLINSKKAVYIDECLYHYRRNNMTSFTKGYREGLFKKWLYWGEYVKDFLDNNTQTQKAYDAYYSRICFSIIPLSGNALKQNNFKDTYKEFKKILNNESYREAYSKLDYSYFPLHWNVYFKFAKWKFVPGVYLMSKIMRIIIEAKKR